MSEIRVMIFDRQTSAIRSGGEELLDNFDPTDRTWYWVDMTGAPSERKERIMRKTFAVPKLAVQDANRQRHPPKLEHVGNQEFLMLRDIAEGGADPSAAPRQLSMFIHDDHLLTVHPEASISVDRAWETMASSTDELQQGSGHVVYRICRAIVDTMTPVVLGHEEALAYIEDNIFENPDDTVLEELSSLNRVLRRLRRVLIYQSKVIDQLRQNRIQSAVTFDIHEITDIYENMDRLATLCQVNQELAVDLLNTHLSVVSHRLNIVMRALTVATILFLPLGLLAGIYGMNFQVMPELSWHYGYFGVLGAMAVIATGLIIFFRRKDWL